MFFYLITRFNIDVFYRPVLNMRVQVFMIVPITNIAHYFWCRYTRNQDFLLKVIYYRFCRNTCIIYYSLLFLFGQFAVSSLQWYKQWEGSSLSNDHLSTDPNNSDWHLVFHIITQNLISFHQSTELVNSSSPVWKYLFNIWSEVTPSLATDFSESACSWKIPPQGV